MTAIKVLAVLPVLGMILGGCVLGLAGLLSLGEVRERDAAYLLATAGLPLLVVSAAAYGLLRFWLGRERAKTKPGGGAPTAAARGWSWKAYAAAAFCFFAFLGFVLMECGPLLR